MKHTATKMLSLLLVCVLFFSLAACSGSYDVKVDDIKVDGGDGSGIKIGENGLATWNAVDGAVCYAYNIVDAEYCSMGEQTTTETQMKLPEGFSIHVQPVFEGDRRGDWMTSDYYGEPRLWRDVDPGMMPPEIVSEPVGDGEAPVIGEISIAVDENGWATWEPVDGVDRYEYDMINYYGSCVASGEVSEPTVRVYADHCVVIRAMQGNGEIASGRSAYRGEQPPEMDIGALIYWSFSTRLDEMQTWSLMDNIRLDTLQASGEGLTFTATAPDGSDMRFVTTEGVSIQDGEITLEPNSRVYALDAIGRICAYMPVVSDPGENGEILFSGGYTFTDERSVESLDDLFTVWGSVIETRIAADPQSADNTYPMVEYQPNMVGFGAYGGYGQSSYSLSDMVVYYDEATYTTPIDKLYLDYSFYGSYLEGQLYDPSKEVYDPGRDNYTFYLMLMPKLLDEINPKKPDFMLDSSIYVQRSVIDIAPERYEIGDLKDADGNVLNKATDPLSIGCTLEITIAGQTYDLELPIIERFEGAKTLHEMTPYGNIPSVGETTALVVPVQWTDYADPAPQETSEMLRTKLGRVVDENGNVTDYSTDAFSLSAYYDAVSYGKYHLDCFLTDWVTAPYTLEEAQNIDLLTHPLPDEIMEQVRELYPDMDWSRFDSNKDGIIDSVIYIAAAPEGDILLRQNFLGGVQNRRGYDATRAGTPENPNLKDFISIGTPMLAASEHVILHEYAHNFGLIDYYDVSGAGIDAVGTFDMQSGNYGDWNAYSKYSVGWLEPEVVEGLASGESVELTIGALAETGDAIVIPAAGAEFDGPFDEYILVDLFSATGVNESDAAMLALEGETGVRISHVNAGMERRTLVNNYGDETDIGTVNVANNYKDSGKYHLEVIQNGGTNTFTDPNVDYHKILEPQDLFHAGDSFDAANYGEFFLNGRFDNGSEFGYVIEIVSIEGNEATVRITAK